MHLYVRKVSPTGVQTFQLDITAESTTDDLRTAICRSFRLPASVSLFTSIHGVKVVIVGGWRLSKFHLSDESVVLVEHRRRAGNSLYVLASGVALKMLEAAQTGHLSLLQELYLRYESQGMCSIDDDGSVLEACNAMGWNCLHFACHQGHATVAEWLLQQEVSINVETVDGWTPLALAAARGHTQCIALLSQDCRLQVNYCSKVRKTALHVARLAGKDEAVQSLLDLGACIAQCGSDGGSTEASPKLHRRSSSLEEKLEDLEVPPPFTGILHFSGTQTDHTVFLMLLPQEGRLQRYLTKDDFYEKRKADSDVFISDLLDAKLVLTPKRQFLVLTHRSGRDRYFSDFPEVTSEWLAQIQYSMHLHSDKASLVRKTSVGCLTRCMSQESIAEPASPSDTSLDRDSEVSLSDFEAIDALGAGSFGKVYKVKKKDTGELFALKALSKKTLIENKQLKLVVNEATIHQVLDCPFIVKLHYKFQTPRKLYFVLDYCQNGDLGALISERGSFPEESVRFYMAEVLIALEYLHDRDIVYRDMKPENILLDSEGHVRLTDFGLATVSASKSALHTSFCGTLAYLSPEMLLRKGVSKPADVYGVATVMYEMLNGESPYYSADMPTMLRKIKHGKISFSWRTSSEAKSLLRAALAVEPKDRPTIKQMQQHEFFRGVDWARVRSRAMSPPKLKSRPDSPATTVTLHDQDYSKTPSMEECLLHF